MAATDSPPEAAQQAPALLRPVGTPDRVRPVCPDCDDLIIDPARHRCADGKAGLPADAVQAEPSLVDGSDAPESANPDGCTGCGRYVQDCTCPATPADPLDP